MISAKSIKPIIYGLVILVTFIKLAQLKISEKRKKNKK